MKQDAQHSRTYVCMFTDNQSPASCYYVGELCSNVFIPESMWSDISVMLIAYFDVSILLSLYICISFYNLMIAMRLIPIV